MLTFLQNLIWLVIAAIPGSWAVVVMVEDKRWATLIWFDQCQRGSSAQHLPTLCTAATGERGSSCSASPRSMWVFAPQIEVSPGDHAVFKPIVPQSRPPSFFNRPHLFPVIVMLASPLAWCCTFQSLDGPLALKSYCTYVKASGGQVWFQTSVQTRTA